MTVTANSKAFVVAGVNEGRQEIVQTVPFDGVEDWRWNLVSPNGEYFFQVVKSGTFDIYRSCDYDARTYYYGEDGECQFCNSTLDLFIDNFTCVNCSLSNCLDCTSLTECLVCN